MTGLSQAIREKALGLGFDAVGIASAKLGLTARDRLREFLEAGHHGSMGWMAERADQRSDPNTLWPEARSVVCLGLNYGPAGDALENLGRPSVGNISVYARHRDYHDVVKGKLKHLAQFVASRGKGSVKVFVDTAPVMEKPLAVQAGLGWQGKHTNLVSRRHGSWLFLGEIYSSVELEVDTPSDDHCGSCSRCIDICPTNAFPRPYRLDATRCISYLTIEHQGPIPVDIRPAMGNRIYGCDDCLAVCPWNRFASAARETKLIAREDLISPELEELAKLDDASFRTRFSGSPIKRIGRNRFVRNIGIAIGNSGLSTLRPTAWKLAADADPVVADAGRWAVAQLGL